MIPPIDLSYIAEELDRLAEELDQLVEEPLEGPDADPRDLVSAMQQLLSALQQPQSRYAAAREQIMPPRARGKDITALGDHGIDLLSRLSALAGRLHRRELARQIEELALPLACWIARCDAEIITLDPVVNGAAALANRLKRPSHLIDLYGLLREIGFAVSPVVTQESSSADPSGPWRVFLLNKAIVATRSLQPALMDEAFDVLVDQLPEDALDFFREGMEQVDALDYPPEVRAVMERWFQERCGKRVLH